MNRMMMPNMMGIQSLKKGGIVELSPLQQIIKDRLIANGVSPNNAHNMVKVVDRKIPANPGNFDTAMRQVERLYPNAMKAPSSRQMLGNPSQVRSAATALRGIPALIGGPRMAAGLAIGAGLITAINNPEEVGRLMAKGQIAFQDVKDNIAELANKAGETLSSYMSKVTDAYNQELAKNQPDMPSVPVGPGRTISDLDDMIIQEALPEIPPKPEPFPQLPKQPPPLGHYDIRRYDTSMMTQEEIQRLQEILDRQKILDSLQE